MEKYRILSGKRIIIAGENIEIIPKLQNLLPLVMTDIAISSENFDNLFNKYHYDSIIIDYCESVDSKIINRVKEKHTPVIMLVGPKFSKEIFKTIFYKNNFYYLSRNKLEKLQDILVDILQESGYKCHYLNWYKRLCRISNCYELQIINENPEFWGSLFKY